LGLHPHPQGTVGAGLPIIGTLKHLLETGDKAQLVEGIFSGTLSYIFNTFGDGRPFSEIVKDAKAQVGLDCCSC
jgi:aspartokinase/homoserine dehydrogenase 1